jgi:aminopeptidase-like protein
MHIRATKASVVDMPEMPAISGDELHAFARELFPICRSITGPGLRATLDAIGKRIPLRVREVPSGTRVFDWEVPPEWSIADAYIKDPSGKRVVDFRAHNLHVVNYSTPVRSAMTLAELRPHLHSLPDHPDWIPYRTSYYRPTWGFCLTDRQLRDLADVQYEVCIDSQLAPGSLTLAEAFFPGESATEILLYVHACHPSLANDNLSAIAVATAFAQRWQQRAKPARHGIRLVFGPATIGSITWLALNEPQAQRIQFGLTLASLGDSGPLTYKASRRGDARIDRTARHVMHHHGGRCIDFSPYGYDERQFCSPGFDLPVGRLTRTPNSEYPQYHTSADNLDFIRPEALAQSLVALEAIIEAAQHNDVCRNLLPKCEPRLGPRGLFRTTGGHMPAAFEHAVLWVLNQSDGSRDLLSIAERAGMPFAQIRAAADALLRTDLLVSMEHS